MPLFVKAGSFIPMVDAVKTTDNYSTKNLTVLYYMDKAGSTSNFVMYNDDGTDPDALANGNFESLMFVKKEDERGNPVFLFSKIGKTYKGMPETRQISFVIIGMQEVKKTEFYKNNVKLKKKKPGKPDEGFYFDKIKKQWIVNFTWGKEDVVIITKQKG